MVPPLDKNLVQQWDSCDYADIAISDLDEVVHEWDLFAIYKVHPPLMFLRYRDDIFIIYDADLGIDELKKFLDFCNKYDISVKFTMTEPITEFLNAFTFIIAGILHTRPFSKPCDSHCYMMPNSCHPLHTIENIPYAIALTVYKISSNSEIYNHAKLEYSEYMRARGCSDQIISESFEKVEKLNRKDLIYKTNKTSASKNTRNFPLVCDFNPALPPVGKIINKHKYLLKLHSELTKVIIPERIFVSYRGNKTLKNLIVPSKLKTDPMTDAVSNKDKPAFGSFKCMGNCKLCKHFMESPDRIRSFHTDREFNFTHFLDCKSPNIVYKLDCLPCRRTSVGSTINGMISRWPAHKSHIRKSVKSCEIACHFSSLHQLDKGAAISIFDAQLSKLLRVTIVDQVQMLETDSDTLKIKRLKERETYWQHQLRTLETYGGLNKREARKETSARSYMT